MHEIRGITHVVYEGSKLAVISPIGLDNDSLHGLGRFVDDDFVAVSDDVLL